MQVVVDGLVTKYETIGTGQKTLVFLHGWGVDSSSFRQLAGELAKEYTCLLVDLPGFGGSEPPKKAWFLIDYAEHVRGLLQKLGSKPFAFICHSNGSAIAIKGLHEDVLMAEKLVIYGGAGVRSVQKGKKRFYKMLARTGKPVLFALPKSKQIALKKKWYGAIGSEMMDVPGMEKTFQNVVGEDVVSLAQEIQLPTLLIYGEQDEATPPLYGRMYHEALPSSELEILAGAGHYVFQDRKDAVVKRTKEFLSA